jgi:hypothetical protein
MQRPDERNEAHVTRWFDMVPLLAAMARHRQKAEGAPTTG